MNHSARLLIAATLLFALGCAKQDWIDRTLVTVDVRGVWDGTLEGLGVGGGGEIRLELQQKGPTVTGQLRITGRQAGWPMPAGPIEGRLVGDVFTFTDTRQSFTAELTVDGDEMKGHASSATQFKVSLRRVDPSSPPASPPR
jgi:hypothetical protein